MLTSMAPIEVAYAHVSPSETPTSTYVLKIIFFLSNHSKNVSWTIPVVLEHRFIEHDKGCHKYTLEERKNPSGHGAKSAHTFLKIQDLSRWWFLKRAPA